MTRAQAKKDAQAQTDESGDSTKPALKRKTRQKVRSKKAESVKNGTKEDGNNNQVKSKNLRRRTPPFGQGTNVNIFGN